MFNRHSVLESHVLFMHLAQQGVAPTIKPGNPLLLQCSVKINMSTVDRRTVVLNNINMERIPRMQRAKTCKQVTTFFTLQHLLSQGVQQCFSAQEAPQGMQTPFVPEGAQVPTWYNPEGMHICTCSAQDQADTSADQN